MLLPMSACIFFGAKRADSFGQCVLFVCWRYVSGLGYREGSEREIMASINRSFVCVLLWLHEFHIKATLLFFVWCMLHIACDFARYMSVTIMALDAGCWALP